MLCTGWQSGGIHRLWFTLPDCRVSSTGLGKVQYYSTSGSSKDGPPKPSSGDAPSAEKILSGAVKTTPVSSGEKQIYLDCRCCLMFCEHLFKMAKTVIFLHVLSAQGAGSISGELRCWFLISFSFLLGSSPQGLTKAETIQVKGTLNICASTAWL